MSLNTRNKTILKLRNQRFTLQEIGNKFGITKERVRQIVCNIDNSYVAHPKQKSELQIYLEKIGKAQGRDRVREMVRIRDKHTCRDCKLVKKTEDIFNYNKKFKTPLGKIKSLDVHHIDGNCGKLSLAYESKDKMKGMITLCHKCHYNRPEHRVKSLQFGRSVSNGKKGKKYVKKSY